MSNNLKIRTHKKAEAFQKDDARFTISYVHSDIHYCTFTDGESTTSGGGRIYKDLDGKKFDSLGGALYAVSTKIINGQPNKWKLNDVVESSHMGTLLRLEAEILVDKKNNPATSEQYAEFEQGKLDLWNAHFLVGVRCEYVIPIPVADLSGELADLDIETAK